MSTAPVPAPPAANAPPAAPAPPAAAPVDEYEADLVKIRSDPTFRFPIIKTDSDVMPESVEKELLSKAILDSKPVWEICKEWAGNKLLKDANF